LIESKLNRAAPTESQEFKQWQRVFDELADLLGFTLVVYDKDEYLLGTSRANKICSTIQLEADGLRLCEQDCGSMLSQAAKGKELTTFKCHAHLYNFACPIYVEGKVRFVLLGGRVFRNYQDFAKFTKVAPSYSIRDYLFVDWDNALKFESAKYFQNVGRFIQSLIDSFSKEPSQTHSVKRRAYQLSTLFDLSSLLPAQSSLEKVYRLILEALGVLFDIQGGAILQESCDGTRFQAASVLGSLLPPGFELEIASHELFEDQKRGQYFFIEETYQILKIGFPETVQSVHNFPLFRHHQMAWVVQIYNTSLDDESVQMLQAFCRHIAIALENMLLKQDVSNHSKALSAVTEFSSTIGSALESEDLYRSIVLKTTEVMRAEKGSLLIYDDISNELSIKFIRGLNQKLIEKLRLKPGEGISGLVYETGRPLLIKDIEQEPSFQTHQRARYKTRSFMSVPLIINHRKIGVLNVADKAGGSSFDEHDLKILQSIAIHASVALERTDFYQKSEDLRKISITDSLTDLFNRRFFQDRLTEEIERAKRHTQSLSLIMLDIDNFKKYNDTYGHQAGDEALRMIAGIIRNSVRNIDMVARYGGEEFAVILPVTEASAAKEIAERIRSGVASGYYPDETHRSAVKLTASLGIACFPQDADSLFDLVGNADKALYLAKVSGKNRVSLFDRARTLKNAVGC